MDFGRGIIKSVQHEDANYPRIGRLQDARKSIEG